MDATTSPSSQITSNLYEEDFYAWNYDFSALGDRIKQLMGD